MADGAIRADGAVEIRPDDLPDGFRAESPVAARIATLDAAGLVTWTNASWGRPRDGAGMDDIKAITVGTNFASVCRRSRHQAGGLIADGVEAVLRREITAFEVQYRRQPSRDRFTQVVVESTPQVADGAVVIVIDLLAGARPRPAERPPVARPSASVAADLTPRERDVLTRMARGLDNQAIADELGIGYTTVRAHTRSLMAKLEARSRLEAVVTALRLRIVDD